MKQRLFSCLCAFALLAVTPLSAQLALRAAFVESADVFLFLDAEAMNQSEFSQAVDAQQTEESKAEAEEIADAFTEATGLTEDDLLSIAFAMDIDQIDFESEDPAQLENIQALLALELAKPVTLDQVKGALDVMAKQSDGPVPDVEQQTLDGMEVLTLTGTDNPSGVDKAYATLGADGKAVLLSFNLPSLKAGLSRLSDKEPAAPTADMATATASLGDQQLRMVLVLPGVARAKIQEGVQMAAAQGGMGAMLMPFAGMKSLLIGANATDSLDFSLSLDLGDPGNAQQAAGMVQSMLPMMMMGLQEQLGPNAMALAQKVVVAPEGGVVTVSMNLTADDVKSLPAAPVDSGTE